MYYYKFNLKFAKKKTNMNFFKCRYILEEAIDAINMGLTFKRDGKSFTINEIKENSLTLTLSSSSSLTNPSRSISALTRYCTTYYTDVFKDILYNKTLFHIELVSKEKDVPILPKDISNEELLKGMIDLLYGYTSNYNSDTLLRNKTIQEIKQLIAPFINKKDKDTTL